MKHLLHIIFVVLLFASVKVFSQDKLFFKNGTQLKCKIIAISQNTITYRDTIVNSPLVTVLRKDILIAEYRSGDVYIFGHEKKDEPEELIDETREQRKEREMKEWKKDEEGLSNSILGFYLPSIAFGRFTVSYEKLFANKTMGITVPFSLTYNPFVNASSNSSSSSTSTNSGNNRDPARGVGFITGVDVNYYYDLRPELKYYFGPRIRYGTDMMLGGIEGLTVQLQNGIFRSRGKRLTNTLGFGVGFFKLSSKYANYPGYEPNQVYPWMSLTWRLGFRI